MFKTGLISKVFYAIAVLFIFLCTEHGLPYYALISLIVLAIIMVGIGNLFRVQSNRTSKRIFEKKAFNIIQNINRNRVHEPFFLYLRPFYVTQYLKIKNPRYRSGVIRPSHFLPENIQWETVLAEAVFEYGPLLALGMDEQIFGAIRIENKERGWKRMFIQLANRAMKIFIIPSSHEGTGWEIEYLFKNRLLNKTIFIMPQKFNAYYDNISKGKERLFNENWGIIKKKLQKIGLQLPEYNPKGLLFTMAKSGELNFCAQLKMKRIKKLCVQLLSFNPELKKLGEWQGQNRESLLSERKEGKSKNIPKEQLAAIEYFLLKNAGRIKDMEMPEEDTLYDEIFQPAPGKAVLGRTSQDYAKLIKMQSGKVIGKRAG